MSDPLLWWAYLHTNGSIQVKRFFGRGDMDAASESPFVAMMAGPFDARDRENAIAIAEARLR